MKDEAASFVKWLACAIMSADEKTVIISNQHGSGDPSRRPDVGGSIVILEWNTAEFRALNWHCVLDGGNSSH